MCFETQSEQWQVTREQHAVALTKVLWLVSSVYCQVLLPHVCLASLVKVMQ